MREGARTAASGLFSQRGGWLLSTADLIPSCPRGSLLTLVMEGAEGTPGNLLRLPLQTAVTVCGEKSDGIHSHYSTPMQVGRYTFLLRGQAKLHSKIHGLPHMHSGENAHDLEFGITIPASKPILEKWSTF